AAERLIAGVLRASARGRAPLPVLLTTTDLIAGHRDGALGPVWREPAAEAAGGRSPPLRRAWLLPAASTAITAIRGERARGATAAGGGGGVRTSSCPRGRATGIPEER